MALSATQVAKFKTPEKELWVSDGDKLFLVITPKGSKIWKMKYIKPFVHKRTNMTLGHYPAISLQQARALRDEYNALLAQNIDPQEHLAKTYQQELNRREQTFGNVAKSWFESKQNIKPETLNKYWRTVELYLLPQLCNVPISDVIPRVVKPVLDVPYSQGKAEVFRKCIKLLNAILNYAVNSLFVLDINPCVKITSAFESLGHGTNPNIHYDDLPTLLKDVANSNSDLMMRYLFMWQLLTMTRPVESARAEWSEIDEEKGIWIIPAEKMKNKTEHRIALSSQAKALLDNIKRFKTDSPFLFHSSRAKAERVSEQSVNKLIRDLKCGAYLGKQTAHGLRKIASSYLHEKGVLPDVVELCLSHTIGGLRGVYMTSKYDKHRLEALQIWGDYVEQCQIVSMSTKAI